MDDSKLKAIKEKGAALRLRLSDKWQDFRERMHHKHRFVVMDTDTFKETFSIELTGTNVFTYVGISIIVLLIIASLIIAFTPLRGIIPGYIKPELQTVDGKKIVYRRSREDSLLRKEIEQRTADRKKQEKSNKKKSRKK